MVAGASRSVPLLVLATAALAGCSENTSSQLLVPASIHITSARLIDDTIDAAVGPMLVEVRDDHGHLVPGGVISISASDELLGTPVFWGSDPDMLPGGRPDTIRTHADGIARVYLRFNARIGNFFVCAAAGQSRDSIAVTIRPGKPFS